MKIETPQSAVKAPPQSSGPFLPYKFIGVIIVFVVVIGLILYLFLTQTLTKKDQQFQGDDPFLLKSVTFYDAENENRTKELLSSIDKSKNSEATEETLFKSFFLLKTDYQQQPSEEKRKSLIAIHDYYATHFPENIKKVEPIPCLQEECGYKFEDTDQIKSLREILENKDVNPNLLYVLKRNLDDASFAAQKDESGIEFFHIENFFINLKNGTSEKRTQGIIDKLNETLELLEEMDPARFKLEVEADTLKL